MHFLFRLSIVLGCMSKVTAHANEEKLSVSKDIILQQGQTLNTNRL